MGIDINLNQESQRHMRYQIRNNVVKTKEKIRRYFVKMKVGSTNNNLQRPRAVEIITDQRPLLVVYRRQGDTCDASFIRLFSSHGDKTGRNVFLVTYSTIWQSI